MPVDDREGLKREIDRYIAIERARLINNELEFLHQFITQYHRFRDLRETPPRKEERLYSSDGWYRKISAWTYHFDPRPVAIYEDFDIWYDDGPPEVGRHEVEMTARNVIRWFQAHSRRRMFDGVRDIVGLIA